MSVDLLCIYPHEHEVTGKRILPGDFRAVPDELVDQFLAKNHIVGQALFVRDPYAPLPSEEQLGRESAAKLKASQVKAKSVEESMGMNAGKLSEILQEQAKQEAEELAKLQAEQEAAQTAESKLKTELDIANEEAAAEALAKIEAEVLAQMDAEAAAKAEANKASSAPAAEEAPVAKASKK